MTPTNATDRDDHVLSIDTVSALSREVAAEYDSRLEVIGVTRQRRYTEFVVAAYLHHERRDQSVVYGAGPVQPLTQGAQLAPIGSKSAALNATSKSTPSAGGAGAGSGRVRGDVRRARRARAFFEGTTTGVSAFRRRAAGCTRFALPAVFDCVPSRSAAFS